MIFSCPNTCVYYGKRSDTQSTYLSYKIHNSNGTESGLHTKSKEVRFDTNTTIHIYGYGISNSAESSSGSSESSYSDHQTILSQTQVSARTFLSLLGKLSAAADLILLGRLHLRPLQMCLLSVWKPHILPLDHRFTINSMIKFHLKWWMNTNRFVQGG